MKKHTHRIALTIPSLATGGMERVMSVLANQFCTLDGIEVHLIMYGINPTLFYEIDNRIIVHKPNTKFNARFRLFGTIRRMLYIRKTVKSISPSTVLSFGTLWNRFVLLSLAGTGIPVFISNRGNPDKNYGWFYELVGIIVIPLAKGIIAQTGYARKVFSQKYRHPNITVIGNPIRSITGKTAARENIILSVGRMIETKNYDLLIRVFAKLDAPGWKLVIIGSDSQKQNIMSELNLLVRNLNLEGRVELPGTQNNVDDFYLKAKIFAFSSSSEGFPNVVGEAMAAGMAVVSFDCVAGPSDIITNDVNGFLVPVFDEAVFQDKIQQLVNNKNLRIRFGIEAIKGMARFSVPSISTRFLQTILSDYEDSAN